MNNFLLAACCAFFMTPRAAALEASGAAQDAVNAAAAGKAAASSSAPEKNAVLSRSWITGEKPVLRTFSQGLPSKQSSAGLIKSFKGMDPFVLAGDSVSAGVPAPAAAAGEPAGKSWLERFLESGREAWNSIFSKREAVLPARGDEKLRTELIDELVSGILQNGASEKARAEAARIMRKMLENTPTEDIRGLIGNNTTVALIPKGKKLTDLPEWTRLKGKYTFDGRLWDDVAGVAGWQGESVVISAKEQNLTEKFPWDGYPPRHAFVHEFGHAVQYGLPSEARAQIKSHFEEQKQFTDDYAKTSDSEYFAQATAVWFGANKWGVLGMVAGSPAWFAKNDPKLYSILESVYGPPRKV